MHLGAAALVVDHGRSVAEFLGGEDYNSRTNSAGMRNEEVGSNVFDYMAGYVDECKVTVENLTLSFPHPPPSNATTIPTRGKLSWRIVMEEEKAVLGIGPFIKAKRSLKRTLKLPTPSHQTHASFGGKAGARISSGVLSLSLTVELRD